MRAVAIMSDQRAFASLAMVILGAGKTVVDDQHRAGGQSPADQLDQCLGGWIDLAQVVTFGGKARIREYRQTLVAQWPLGPLELIAVARDAALEPSTAASHNDVRRYRIKHFIHDDGARDGGGNFRRPFDAPQL